MMKRKITNLIVLAFFAFTFSVSTIFAQVPQAFNYQAVARNAAGTLMANQAVGIEIIIHQASAAGTAV